MLFRNIALPAVFCKGERNGGATNFPFLQHRERVYYGADPSSAGTYPVAPHGTAKPIVNSIYELQLTDNKLNAVMLDGHVITITNKHLPFLDQWRASELYYSYFWFPVKGNRDW